MEARFIVKQYINEDDSAAFAKVHYAKQLRIGAAISMLAFTAVIVLSNIIWNWISWTAAAVSCIVFCGIFLWEMRSQRRKIARELMKAVNPKAGTTTLSLYDEKAVDQDNLSENVMSYGNFVEIVENEAYFFLYIQKNQAYILNKLNFTHGNPAEFASFISEKTGLEVKRVKG